MTMLIVDLTYDKIKNHINIFLDKIKNHINIFWIK